MAVGGFAITDRDLLDVAVLAEEFGFAKRLEEFVLPNGRRKACYIHKVLLHDTDTLEVLTAFFLGLALLNLLLTLFG